MHDAAFRFVERVAGQSDRDGLTVEIGGLNINGTVRKLFGPRYISVDRVQGPGVDVVADGATYEPPAKASTVVCCEVLEHAENAADICQNALRMLATGGLFIVTAAGPERVPHSAVDGGPLRAGEFYHNIEERELLKWLGAFQDVQISLNPAAGDIYATARKPAKKRKTS